MASSVNDFIAGYISGVAGLIIGSPLDVLKVRLQAQKQPIVTRNAASSKTSFSGMIQNEGIRSLFKGISSPIVGLAGLNSILFASYSATMRFMGPSSLDPLSSTMEDTSSATYQPLSHVFTAGFVAGVACFLVSTPTELVKCRAQLIANSVESNAAKNVLSESGSWNIAKDIMRRFGPRGFYQGGWVTILRDAPGYGVYFLSYEGLKRLLDIPTGETGGINTWKLLFAGGMAGTLSWASIYPLDVIKTRIQTQPHLVPETFKILPTTAPQLPSPVTGSSSGKAAAVTATANSHLLGANKNAGLVHQTARHGHSIATPAPTTPRPYKGIVDCAVRSYQSEGMGVFVRGATPALLRAFPVNAVTFFVYELVMAELSKLD